MKDFSPIVNPNLPTDKVRHIVASGEYTQYINELNNCGISVLTTQICNDILPAVRSHADMVFAYLGNARYIIEKSQKNLKKEFLGFWQQILQLVVIIILSSKKNMLAIVK